MNRPGNPADGPPDRNREDCGKAMTQDAWTTRKHPMVLGPGRVVLGYVCVGLAWIFLSDSLVGTIFRDHPDLLVSMSMFKGVGFVLLTAGCLYLLLRRHLSAFLGQDDALRQSQAHYRLVVENAPEAIVVHDAAYRFVYANAAALTLFGAESAGQLLGRPVLDRVAPASRGSVGERMRQVVEEGIAVALRRQRYLRLDGTAIEVEGGAVPFPVHEGKGGLAFLRDIGLQLAAECSLRDSEAKYRLLADNAHDVIFTLDAALRQTYVSPSVTRLRGFTPEESMAQSLEQTMTRDSLVKVSDLVSRLSEEELRSETRVECLELEMQRKDGSTVWTETVVRPMRDAEKRFLGFIGVSRDITDRRQAEEERNRSREFLERILNTIPDPVFVKDAAHRFVLVNDALCALIGRSAKEIIGRRDADFMPREEAEAFVARDDLVLATGEENIAEEPVTDGQGRQRTVVTKKGLFIDTMGGRFLVGVIRDVTEDKVQEARLRDSLLEKEVLLKEVHHRVKNNLQVISSLLFLQKDGIEDPAIQELFEESRHRIGSMALVHEELYRSGDLGRVDVREYLERLAPRIVEALRGGKQLELSLDLAPCRLPVDKAIPFGLVINELLTNAVKHGFRDRSAGTIGLRLSVDEGRVQAVVEDDGVGLATGFHPETSKTLGMQLVVQLTRQLGGALVFGSGPGAVFRLSFPLAEGARE